MRFYKKRFVLALAVLIVVSFVFSSTVFALDNFEAFGSYFDNLEQNETQKEIQRIQNLILEDNLRQAKEDSISAYISYLMKPFEAEVNLKASAMGIKAQERKLNTDGKKLILEGIILACEERAEREKLEIYEERLRQVRIKVARLEATDDDIKQSIITVDTQKLNLEALEKRIGTNSEKLAELFDADPEDFVFADGDIILMDEKIADTDSLIDNAREKSVEYYKAENALYVAKNTLNIIKEHFAYPHRSYLNGYLAYINAENSYKNTDESIVNSVLAAVDNLKVLKDRLDLVSRSLAITQRRYSLTNTRFNNHLVSIDSLLSARESLINAVYQEQLAIYRYNGAKIDLDLLVGY